MDKDALEAKILLAKAQAHRKAYDSALETFEQVRKSLTTQDNTIDDPEYFYLYGETLESKNLFSQAIQEYDKVTGTLQKDAKERIKLIKPKEEEGIPHHIIKISHEAKDFVEKMDGEAVIIFLYHEDVEITPQDTCIHTIHVIEQVLEEKGKDIAEVETSYDSTYQRVELEFARSISQDGKVVYAGKENIRDIGEYTDFPLYNNARAFIISMPSVDVGSYIEYRLRVYSSQLINEDDFCSIYRLREIFPIFKAQFKFIVPEKRKVHFKFFNESYAPAYNLKPSLEEKDDKKIYTGEFNKIEPLIMEYNMPPTSVVNPTILISSFSSWQEIYEWWHTLLNDKLAFNKEGQNIVREIVKDVHTDLEKAKRLYEFCAENIRYVAVEYGSGGYEPHTAQQVLLNRYGDCKDQAILLVAMLRLIGIKAYPVLIPTRKKHPVDEDFPYLNFNHVICTLEHQGNFIFMDPTEETVPFGKLPLSDQDRSVMVFLENSWQFLQTPQTEVNETIYRMHIVVDEEENATITRTETKTGFFTPSERQYLKYSHPHKIKEDIQNEMVRISSFSRLLNYEIQNIDDFDKEPVLTYTFVTRHFLKPAGTLRILPALTGINLDYKLINKEERNFPIDFEAIFTDRSFLTITLPKNLSIKYLPGNSRLENEWFTFNSLNKSRAQEVSFKKEFVIKKRFVEPSEYREFKSQLEKVLYLLEEQVILEKIPS